MIGRKQIACLAHARSCAGCGSEGDEEIEWPHPGEYKQAFMFDSHAAMETFARSGFCQKCQRKAN